jgi:hypothetical protein
MSIFSLCTMLFVFKYFNFCNADFAALAAALHWNYSIEALSIARPIGLSFHTFQSLSYVIEVYRGRQKAEHHLRVFALYVMYFPQLVAGPIERPQPGLAGSTAIADEPPWFPETLVLVNTWGGVISSKTPSAPRLAQLPTLGGGGEGCCAIARLPAPLAAPSSSPPTRPSRGSPTCMQRRNH